MTVRSLQLGLPLGLRYAAAPLLFLVALVLWLVLLDERRWTSSPDAFDVVSWQLAAAPGKWLYAIGAPLRRDPAADEALMRYFAIQDQRNAEAQDLEGTVEAVLEGRLDAALGGLGFPGVPGLSVWPPVDIELTSPPRVLAQSPRARIELVSRALLRPGLTLGQAEALEREIETAGDRSAAVLPIGGLSTYPAIVSDEASYTATVGAAAHEWVHHYLAFHPLGWGAIESRDALRINETVADLAGAEIAAAVLARFGTPGAIALGGEGDLEATRGQAQRLADRDLTLRALRLEVDALLVEGRIDEAEQRMEDVRLQLAERGITIRRLNQAYFAWTGTYAARGDSIDVLGGQLREVRSLAGSPRRFLEVVRDATSREDIAALLARLRVPDR